MTHQQFATIVDQLVAAEIVPRVVVLYHGGEPLLNRRVPDFVKTLKQVGVSRVQVVTNGSLLSAGLSEELIRAGLDEIHVSFDGESAEENDATRRNGLFHRDAGNLKTFCALYRDIGQKPIRILVSNVRIMDSAFIEASRGAEEVAVPDYLTRCFDACCGEELEFQSLPAMVWPGLVMTEAFEVVSVPGPNPEYCGPLFETLTIMANGDVVPCCYDLKGEVVFGNAFESNILGIWASPGYAEFRSSFRRRAYPDICSRCNTVNPRYLCKRPA
jgi:radical SAM protein with 4Fe4S-binding SPASM domain